ncbi:DUF1835 domain-containing protein [Legionella cardiaca]|uniref:DUF1835 domain-containing protein n=1 Tax=Legionella cardiaca TaxID=1071983 RepID=A0ABY8AUV2_9GAMM|nr:DUF1835 domain-containing protein [Legionella cardiaca]WED44477.1 DUF1835 domain-containing protein [Legionella cardiaca]
MNSLHITNGDFSAELIKTACKTEDVIAWRDILYEGPVRGDLSFSVLGEERAKYLATAGYGDVESNLYSFQELEAQLLNLKNFKEIILWFEHDTYDQLQLLQVLTYLADTKVRAELSLICINHYPGVSPFLGLGQLDEQQIHALFPCRQKITNIQLQLAQKLWNGFTANEPTQLVQLVKGDLSALTFMKNALLRYFREFPSNHNGLTWTEQYILDSIIAGVDNVAELFRRLPLVEKEYFLGMGDITFKHVVRNLAEAVNPLVVIKQTVAEFEESELELSNLGERVANGDADWIILNGIDCWRGGVHLTLENVWRYSLATNEMIGPFNLKS